MKNHGDGEAERVEHASMLRHREVPKLGVARAKHGDRRCPREERSEFTSVEYDERDPPAPHGAAETDGWGATGDERDARWSELEEEPVEGERSSPGWERAETTDFPGVDGREHDRSASEVEEDEPWVTARWVKLEHRGWGSRVGARGP